MWSPTTRGRCTSTSGKSTATAPFTAYVTWLDEQARAFGYAYNALIAMTSLLRAHPDASPNAIIEIWRRHFPEPLELPPHVIALHLGHTDGGRLVRELYGHPDAALARQRTREAFRAVAPVTALPSQSEAVAS
jgi:hypothetical protein